MFSLCIVIAIALKNQFYLPFTKSLKIQICLCLTWKPKHYHTNIHLKMYRLLRVTADQTYTANPAGEEVGPLFDNFTTLNTNDCVYHVLHFTQYRFYLGCDLLYYMADCKTDNKNTEKTLLLAAAHLQIIQQKTSQ